jgi:hypothetical protein
MHGAWWGEPADKQTPFVAQEEYDSGFGWLGPQPAMDVNYQGCASPRGSRRSRVPRRSSMARFSTNERRQFLIGGIVIEDHFRSRWCVGCRDDPFGVMVVISLRRFIVCSGPGTESDRLSFTGPRDGGEASRTVSSIDGGMTCRRPPAGTVYWRGYGRSVVIVASAPEPRAKHLTP